MKIPIIPNDDALVLDLVEEAREKGLYLIYNGRRTILSPTIPAGWRRLIVKIKSPTFAALSLEAS